MNLPVTLARKLLVIAAISLTAACSLSGQKSYIGFDRNEYPGDASLPALRKHFDFAGYWLTNPPGSHRNGWLGKRDILLQQGFGFLVLANGKLDKEILRSGIKPDALGRRDATAAIAAAQSEHFPRNTILFLDQEEGGRLLPEQMAYLLAWTETVATNGYRPGIYVSGQTVHEGPNVTITTALDVRNHVAAQHLHEVAMWVYEDDCPPAPGCTLQPPPLAHSGTPGALVWQYAQSPRRPENTASCAKTYASDGNCYAGELTHLILDMNVAGSPDPSAGR
ncbi:glycoside hydrolase domain-containing protein [Granulicella arctica]|uniref:glycoside hydrolase domain-containing protein n=1 Tax=Granulicella arctica TaxID=940613 RepID=UPI0021E07EB9|nr:glycoside hydrolase domain-containing protein [Granulicella arctica]